MKPDIEKLRLELLDKYKTFIQAEKDLYEQGTGTIDKIYFDNVTNASIELRRVRKEWNKIIKSNRPQFMKE